ncbi:AMP-binding protein [Amycolatopsis cynarae]|uniref:AMP-binding protein n=1 Tax=Amycolatopsis cynarae TaxID=2995223 RepID=A0ABY7B8S2_9PSEU|nr:AMP-binding protein [Amycolatopsis sp. HUAS 11-8]WAL68339.1 AMP-binding protein [Amycolatopsis sp. HUAS 11-8]
MTWFPIPPLIHGAAQWAALAALFGGNTVLLTAKFDAANVWRLIERHRAGVAVITGDAMGRPMIEALRAGDYDTSSLVALASSAALFSPSVKRQFVDALPNTVITDSIGSSETGFGGIKIVGRDPEYAGGPRVPPGREVLVIDEAGRPVVPGSGVIGRFARGGHVPLGYYKDPEKTAALFVEVDGARYVTPGDFARVEADGTITLLGRGNMCINTGGEKVFPEEVEGTLKAHPGVFDAIVVGVPDERLGHRVAAVVQARPGWEPDLPELNRHLRQSLAGYKVPRSLWLAEKVERTPSGKPDYRWAQRYTRERSAFAHAD